ncbi:putative trans-sialidase [Trypanosoma cruzi]|nr:putative trans-sialidase [Trypanosoma cruzi]
MGQTVLYCFTNNEFTLSATVTIHEVPEASSSPIPLIGARLNDKDGTALVQLSWTSEGNLNLTLHKKDFLVKLSGGVGNWGTNTAIRVTVQKNGAEEWFLYASGRRMYETDDGELGAEEVARLRNADAFGSRRILHFFGAGDKEDEEGSHVTVADVLLHNDALFGDDLSKPQRRDSSYSTSGCRRTARCGGGHRDGGRKSRRSGSWMLHSWQLQRGRPQRRKTHSRLLHCRRPHS